MVALPASPPDRASRAGQTPMTSAIAAGGISASVRSCRGAKQTTRATPGRRLDPVGRRRRAGARGAAAPDAGMIVVEHERPRRNAGSRSPATRALPGHRYRRDRSGGSATAARATVSPVQGRILAMRRHHHPLLTQRVPALLPDRHHPPLAALRASGTRAGRWRPGPGSAASSPAPRRPVRASATSAGGSPARRPTSRTGTGGRSTFSTARSPRAPSARGRCPGSDAGRSRPRAARQRQHVRLGQVSTWM